jgi:hypothetical protein
MDLMRSAVAECGHGAVEPSATRFEYPKYRSPTYIERLGDFVSQGLHKQQGCGKAE